MQPIDFEGRNKVFTKPQGWTDDECQDLPTLIFDGKIISCWKLSPEEIEEIQRTGVIWLSVYGMGQPPVLPQVDKPFKILSEEESKDVDLFVCPQRMRNALPGEPPPSEPMDWWLNDTQCTYCGGVRPEAAFTILDAGAELVATPAEGLSVLYLKHERLPAGRAKIYLWHFDAAQTKRLREYVANQTDKQKGDDDGKEKKKV